MIDGCPFCRYQGPSSLYLDFGDTYIIEPLEPVVPGHVLVVPFAHHEHALVAPTVFSRAAYIAARYAREADLGACNIITSCGTAATQTVNHLHLHVVPRIEGDGLALPWAEVAA